MVRGEVEMKMVEGGEVEIFVEEVEKIFVGRKEIKEKEKGKEIRMRRYFLEFEK